MGALASGLCLIHCIATPFLFLAHAEVSTGHHHHESPFWWGLIDIALVIVSFWAVHWAASKSSRQWMKWALRGTWFVLAFIILNEKLELMHLPEEVIYVPALGLIGLHLYNRKYCQCADEECCTVPETK